MGKVCVSMSMECHVICTQHSLESSINHLMPSFLTATTKGRGKKTVQEEVMEPVGVFLSQLSSHLIFFFYPETGPRWCQDLDKFPLSVCVLVGRARSHLSRLGKRGAIIHAGLERENDPCDLVVDFNGSLSSSSSFSSFPRFGTASIILM